jgi:2-isopropylmalate synthase
MRSILIFDTTLRDGEKSPGTILTITEKIRLANQLGQLHVDVLEAGFPAASEEQYESVGRIAREVQGPVIAAMARATNPKDFEIAWEVLKDSSRPRFHTFVPASRQYREHFLKKNAEQTRELAVAAIRTARQFTADVEFSLVDSFRANLKEVVELVRAGIDAGATTINLADTVGYATPLDVTQLFQKLRQEVDAFDRVVFSIHCHNDLGLAVANSLAAILEGAGQVHCTINGIGERTGNTALEELVMALTTHSARLGVQTGIHLEQIYPTSRLVRRISGIGMAPQKPVVGDNAFVYETLVPQLSDSTEAPPYEIMNPEQLGIYTTGYRLTPGATWEQFQQRIKELGYDLNPVDVGECFRAFQELAAKKEIVFDADLELLVNERAFKDQMRYKLLYLNVTAGSISVPNATVQLEVDGQVIQDAGFGHGPVDAAFKTIYKMAKRAPKLIRYEVNAVTSGTDALGEVVVRLEEGAQQANGRGVDTDIVLASAKALINGLNKLEYGSKQEAVYEFTDDESFLPRL